MYCSKCWQEITKGPIRKYPSSFETTVTPVETLSQAGVPSPASGGQQEKQEKKEAEVQKLEDVLKNILVKETGSQKTEDVLPVRESASRKTENVPPVQDVLFGKKASIPAGIKTAGFFERFQAMLIDGFFIVFAIVFFRIFGLGLPIPFHMLSWIISPVYFVFFISRFGQTPGKWFMGLKVVSEDGRSPVSMERAFIRWLGYTVNMMFFGLGYLWIFIDPAHQGFHDKMAKTLVIKAR